MDSLFRNDILIGDSENFEVNPEFKKDLIKWRKMNIKHLFIIRKMIKDEESKENSEFSPEQLLGRTRRIAQRIKL